MEPILRDEHNSTCFDQFDRDLRLKRALTALENENSRLKKLVVRLSETIIRNVVNGKS